MKSTDLDNRGYGLILRRMVSIYILLVSVAGWPGFAGTIGLHVVAEDNHPADTLFVGRPGWVYVTLDSLPSDSVDAVVLAFTMAATAPGPMPIAPVLESHWEWLGGYAAYELAGFNDTYQNSNSPDSGVMYVSTVGAKAVSTSQRYLARFGIQPVSPGLLRFDTLTIRSGHTQSVSAVMLMSNGYMSVPTSLSAEFAPIHLVACGDVSITCRTVIDTNIQSAGELCISMPILEATDVVSSYGLWRSGRLCMPIDTSGNYRIAIIGRNLCSADSCTIDISVHKGCCLMRTGNVDCDPGNGVDISDLSRLVDFLYVSFLPLCCEGEANVDGQPGIDISDLSALVDYLYVSFTPPAACQ